MSAYAVTGTSFALSTLLRIARVHCSSMCSPERAGGSGGDDPPAAAAAAALQARRVRARQAQLAEARARRVRRRWALPLLVREGVCVCFVLCRVQKL